MNHMERRDPRASFVLSALFAVERLAGCEGERIEGAPKLDRIRISKIQAGSESQLHLSAFHAAHSLALVPGFLASCFNQGPASGLTAQAALTAES